MSVLYTETNMNGASGKPQDKIGEREEYLAFLCDRVQKITGAVYRVTDLLPDKEPLKWVIRENVVTTLNSIISIRDKKSFEETGHLMELDGVIDKIIVLFTVFSENNNFSSSNFNILIDEYKAIKKDLASEMQSSDIKLLFSNVGEKKYPQENKPKIPEIEEKAIGHTIGQHNRQISDNGHVKFGNTIRENKTKTPKINPEKRSNWTNKDRKNKIFEMVKNKGKITMGELSGIFNNYSEKTLQRDLVEMVKKGLLRKEGDKRWRTYIYNDKQN